MKHIRFLLFLPLFLGCNNNQSDKHSNSDKLGLDTATQMYNVTDDDAVMNIAIAKAKGSIHEFDEALKSDNPSYTDFSIKKMYNSPEGGEHMWIADITIVNGNYKGIINNDAERTKEVKYGDTVIVPKDEITDWMYLDDNVLKGGYTIRAIRSKMNTADRIKLDKDLGFKIEE